MKLQELRKTLVCQSYNRVMGGGCSKMQYRQAAPSGLKEEGGELPRH